MATYGCSVVVDIRAITITRRNGVLKSSPEALLGESKEESDEIDVAVVSQSGFEIGPMTRIVLADVDGAGGIR